MKFLILKKNYTVTQKKQHQKIPSITYFAENKEIKCRDTYPDGESNRRSHSLDGDLVLGPPHLPPDKNNRTAWGKVKNIIQTHRPGSFKGKSRTRSVKSLGSVGCSRDASPYDSNDGLSFSENFESNSSSQTSPIIKSMTPSLTLTAPNSEITHVPCGMISLAPLSLSSDDYERTDFETQRRRSLISSSSRKVKGGNEMQIEVKSSNCGTVKKNSTRHQYTVRHLYLIIIIILYFLIFEIL